ncbi:MAG: bile acid:sodium symporter [Planctomycetota bacterium]
MMNFLKKRWFLIVLVGVILAGAACRRHAGLLPKSWSLATLFATMFCVGVTAELGALGRAILNWRAAALSLAMTYAAAPLVALGAGWVLFGTGSPLFPGCVLLGAASSTVSTAVVYTRNARGNHNLSIVLSNVSTVAGVVLTPLMVAAVLARSIPVRTGDMILTLAAGILLPILLAQVVARCFPGPVGRFKPAAGVLAQVGILAIVFGSVVKTFAKGDSEFLARLPGASGLLVILALVVYIFLSRLSWAAARRLGVAPADAVAVTYASAQKSLATTVVLADTFFTPVAGLPIIIYHFVQLFHGSFDGDRLARLAEGESPPAPVGRP